MKNDCILRLERLIAGAPEEVFDAWVDPEILVNWWGPEGVTIPEYTLDVRVGGAWSTTMMSPDGDRNICSGVYKAIDRPSRLVFTWAWTQDDGSRGHETEVEITFEAEGDATRIKLLQQAFATAEQAAMHEGGWTSSFDCLERIF